MLTNQNWVTFHVSYKSENKVVKSIFDFCCAVEMINESDFILKFTRQPGGQPE